MFWYDDCVIVGCVFLNLFFLIVLLTLERI